MTTFGQSNAPNRGFVSPAPENRGAFEPAGAEIREGLVRLVERIGRSLCDDIRPYVQDRPMSRLLGERPIGNFRLYLRTILPRTVAVVGALEIESGRSIEFGGRQGDRHG
jgi:hypothetical protein